MNELTEQSGVRCPKCGAYLTGEIPESISSVTCRYCGTTLFIPKKEGQQSIQRVVMLTKSQAREIRDYGKLLEDMTPEERAHVFEDMMGRWKKKGDQKRIGELEEKKKRMALTDKEERELEYRKKGLTDEAGFKAMSSSEYCLSCYRTNKFHCVKCSAATCGESDCESTRSRFWINHIGWWPLRAMWGIDVSLYCPTCNGYVCNGCYSMKESIILTKYYCQKCGSRLEKRPVLGK